jgi:hypothetical protein
VITTLEVDIDVEITDEDYQEFSEAQSDAFRMDYIEYTGSPEAARYTNINRVLLEKHHGKVIQALPDHIQQVPDIDKAIVEELSLEDVQYIKVYEQEG